MLGSAPVRTCHSGAPSKCTRRQTRICSVKTASELRSDIIEKRCSAVDVVKHHLELIKASEDRLGSFLHVDEKGALSQARFLTRKLLCIHTLTLKSSLTEQIKGCRLRRSTARLLPESMWAY